MPQTATGLAVDPLLAHVREHVGYKVLGGVVLYQKLGQGGMGAVYKGRHLRLDMDVAVKIMAPPAGLSPSHADNFIQRFLREARTAASISHQNLIRVIDVNTESGVYYLVMDYIDGESAADRLKRKGALPEAEAVEICLGAAEGLAAAHERGIVHRDVKPDNILIDKSGRVVVADLGLAKAYAQEGETAQRVTLTLSQQVVGTPSYISPEQTRTSRSTGPPSDVWSLGVTLYHLVTGSLPWRDTDLLDLLMKIRSEAHPEPKVVRPDLSDGLCRMLAKALKKEPAERFENCGFMGAALRRLFTAVSGGQSFLKDSQASAARAASVAMTPPASKTLSLIAEEALRERERTPSLTLRSRSVEDDIEEAEAVEDGPVYEAEAVEDGPVYEAEAVEDDIEEAVEDGPVYEAEGIRGRASGSGIGSVRPTSATLVGDQLQHSGMRFAPAAVAVGALAALAVLLLLLFGVWREAKPAAPDPLVTEAEVFCQRQGEAAAAGRFAEVAAAIEAAGTKYDRTPAAERIRNLKARAEEELAAARRKEERRQAAFDSAVRAADEAERQGDLEEAIRQLAAALAEVEDQGIRDRMAALERRLGFRRLVAEAEGLAEAGDLKEARAKYQEAAGLAAEAERGDVLARIAELDHRIAVEDAVAAIRAHVDAGRWREAWAGITQARQSGVNDNRLDRFADLAVSELAPKPTLAGPLDVQLVLVPGGSFMMGSDSGEPEERPVHRVTVSSFYVSRYEVTSAQFEAFRQGLREARFSGAADPVASVAWADAVAFSGYLSRLDPSGAAYRLPREAEWEFAARGEAGRPHPWGDAPPSRLHANLALTRGTQPRVMPVGSFPDGATPSGIADLVGNVGEWCADWYGPYGAEEQTDPVGPARGNQRVVRGGACEFGAVWARATTRGCRRPDWPSPLLGFRVIRELTDKEREFERLARQ